MKVLIKKLLRESLNINENDDWENSEYFSPTIPEHIKRHSKRYVGKGVTWYGDPEQMIVVHKDYVDGMFGNEYNMDKMENLTDLIINHEDNVELECSYGHISDINFTDILEQQQSYKEGRFDTDYEGTRSLASIGNEELDDYIGSENLEDSEIMDYEVFDDIDLYELLNENRFYLIHGQTNDEIKEMVKELDKELKEETGESLSDNDYEYVKVFMEVENQIYESVKNSEGDIGTLRVQLRDGHHRIMGAIEAGEDNVCLNLDKDGLKEYSELISKVTYINKIN